MSREAHPALPEFEYIKPKSLEEASQFLVENPGTSRPFLGGTDTFVRLRDGAWKENEYLVDVKGLKGTTELKYSDLGLTIGAAVSMNKVSRHEAVRAYYPLLAEACDSVAAYQLRNRATVVGNICNASPAGDTIGACLLYGGVLHVHGAAGLVQVPLDGFFKGPGKTSLNSGDIVVALHLPVPPEGFTGKYIKLNRNKSSDLAIVGVTAAAYPNPEMPSGLTVRVALASVAPVPLVVDVVEEFFNDSPLTEENILKAAKIAMDGCTPIDDVRGTARYRKLMVRNLTKQALLSVMDEVKGE